MQNLDRIIELMKNNEMDTDDEVLVINCAILYQEAQKDLLKEQFEKLKQNDK